MRAANVERGEAERPETTPRFEPGSGAASRRVSLRKLLVKPRTSKSSESKRAAADDAAQHRDAPVQSVLQGLTGSPSFIAPLGFSLLEVLIAISILSVGILGLAGLQNAALRNGHSALLRTQAALYAYDIVDRMRVNRAAALAGAYNRALTPASAVVDGTSLDLRDQREWLLQLRSLPEAKGGIDVTSNGEVTVTVQWSEAGIGGGTAEFVLRTRI